MTRQRIGLAAAICVVLAVSMAVGETSPAANQDPVYKTLRGLKPTGESLTLENVELKRDAGTFTLSGTLCFAPPVEGKITGAVFSGSGEFSMEPPLNVEKMSLSRLTRQPRIDERFDRLVLRFTDDTYQVLKKTAGAVPRTGTCDAGYWNDIDDALRHSRQLKWNRNLTARILQDVYSSVPGGLFIAYIDGKKFADKEIFTIDPHGAPSVAPEEVSFETWGENRNGIWAAFHLASEYAKGTATSAERNSVRKVEKEEVDLKIERSGRLEGKAKTTVVAQQDGVRLIGLDLYGTLRVQSVTDEGGQRLDFIQEDKDDDNEFWVVLPKSLASGQRFTIVTDYGGKDALYNTGGGNYYLAEGARGSWYPGGGFDEYANFDMRFTFPKGFTVVASGTLQSESHEGSQAVSHWVTEQPQLVAAFQFGRFKKQEKTLPNVALEAYANVDIPDYLNTQHDQTYDLVQDKRFTLGEQMAHNINGINTVAMIGQAMQEGEVSLGLFTNYFGPSTYKRLALTQQTADAFGQSWPQLIWLPLSYFLDNTTKDRLYGLWGVNPRGYFTVVTPHEIAHQWWGHTVTWASYRDQWMSEGFSDASASIYLQGQRGSAAFLKFWSDEHLMLTERNAKGFRANDVGPLTLGYRLDNTRVGWNITRELIYPKGAFILHMIRMMMWNQKTGDQDFKTMMQDFVNTYRNKPATTEDFKAIVEKHMLPTMNMGGDGKMDWFFNQYVYGMELPSYRLEQKLDGMNLKFKVTQSGVQENFLMRVPLYLELDTGIVRLGSVPIKGNSTVEQTIDLGAIGLKQKPKRLILAYYYDVLADKIDQ